MNVVVLGAGTVGQAVAELLCSRGVNVCVIDESADVLRRVEERLDVQQCVVRHTMSRDSLKLVSRRRICALPSRVAMK